MPNRKAKERKMERKRKHLEIKRYKRNLRKERKENNENNINDSL